MKTYDVSSGWPRGISNGLSLDCNMCGKHTNFDYGVDDELWESIVPNEHKRGVVCLDCLDDLAKDKGLLLGEYLKFVQYTGRGETIVLTPEISFAYEMGMGSSPVYNQVS